MPAVSTLRLSPCREKGRFSSRVHKRWRNESAAALSRSTSADDDAAGNRRLARGSEIYTRSHTAIESMAISQKKKCRVSSPSPFPPKIKPARSRATRSDAKNVHSSRSSPATPTQRDKHAMRQKKKRLQEYRARVPRQLLSEPMAMTSGVRATLWSKILKAFVNCVGRKFGVHGTQYGRLFKE